MACAPAEGEEVAVEVWVFEPALGAEVGGVVEYVAVLVDGRGVHGDGGMRGDAPGGAAGVVFVEEGFVGGGARLPEHGGRVEAEALVDDGGEVGQGFDLGAGGDLGGVGDGVGQLGFEFAEDAGMMEDLEGEGGEAAGCACLSHAEKNAGR